jgi:hypothetical protein
LIDRFEQAANTAGVGVAASLEDALTQWIVGLWLPASTLAEY